MCYVVYLGTNKKVIASQWDESKPSFFVEKIPSNELESLKNQFSMKHIYYVGSHTHCGCGFSYDEEFNKEIEDINDSKNDVLKFNELLKEILNTSNECEVFLCWSGDEDEKPECSEIVGPDFFLKGDWVEDKPTFYKVRKFK